MQTTENDEKIEKMIKETAEILRPEVEKIEASIMTTKGHYGEYMALLSSFAQSKAKLFIVSKALLHAGANKEGIAGALMILNG
jgi:RNA binding exosome subunit